MIKFNITRDQARMISDYWLPYMVMSAEAEMKSNAGSDAQFLNALCIVSLIKDLELVFKKKLVNCLTHKLSFKLSIAHGCAFYVYLMKRPINSINIYAFNFRQQLCDHMHKQLFAKNFNPIPAEDLIEYTASNSVKAM